jgi:hypothetical protein
MGWVRMRIWACLRLKVNPWQNIYSLNPEPKDEIQGTKNFEVFFFDLMCRYSHRWAISARVNQHSPVDGWCTDRIFFSIPVPSQVDFFCLPFLSPDLRFFLQLYFFLPAPFPVFFPPDLYFFFFGTLFSPAPHPVSFFFFWLLKLFLATHLLPPTIPLRPSHLHI